MGGGVGKTIKVDSGVWFIASFNLATDSHGPGVAFSYAAADSHKHFKTVQGYPIADFGLGIADIKKEGGA